MTPLRHTFESKTDSSDPNSRCERNLNVFFMNASNFNTKMSFPIETLPDETLLNLFEFLKFKDLGCCLQVSQRFRKIALDEKLWKKIKFVDQGNLLRGIDKKTFKEREFQFVHICSLFCNTLYVRKQNSNKMVSILFVKTKDTDPG